MTRNRAFSALFLAVLFAAGLLACSEQTESERTGIKSVTSDGVLSVYTVNYPLKYFAERIGGINRV